MTTFLVTGGAGFVGSNLAMQLKGRREEARVIALDNLMRRSSELNLPRLRNAGVECPPSAPMRQIAGIE